MTSRQPTHLPTASGSSTGFAFLSFSPRPTVAAFSGRGFDMLRLIKPPPLAANNSQVLATQLFSLNTLRVTYCRSQDYRPPFPQQGVNPSSLECHNLSPTPTATPQCILPREFSPRMPVKLTNPCSPTISSPMTFQQHMLRLSPSPLIVQHTSSPFLVQPIARQIPFHHQYGDSLIKI